MPENKHMRRGLFLAYFAFGILAVWLLLKYALPWLSPFIAAFFISRPIEPLVNLLTTRLRFRRGLASALCTVIVFAVLVALAGALAGRIIYELTALAGDLPSLISELSLLITAMRDKVNVYISAAPFEMQAYLRSALDGIFGKSAGVITALSGKILSFLTSAAASGPHVLIFIVTSAVGTFFISSGYKEVTGFIMRQIPEGHHEAVREFKADLIAKFGRWIKAEAMLSGIAFFELLAAFLIMRVQFAVLFALLLAVIDLLPLLGVGTVLIPWAAVSFLNGDFVRGTALIVTYGVIAVVRNILEPKLVGSQIGLPPITALLAMYIGFRVIGIMGMALFPIGLIMLKHLNDKGYVRLWK